MSKIAAAVCVAAIAAASSVVAEQSTAPVAVTQDAATMGAINTTNTFVAAGIVAGGALIVENADSNGPTSSTTTE